MVKLIAIRFVYLNVWTAINKTSKPIRTCLKAIVLREPYKDKKEI